MPFAPSWDEDSALQGMLGFGGDHRGLRKENIFICSKVLELLLFAAVYGHRQAWIDGLVESGYVVIDVGLDDIAVSVQDMV